MAGIVNRAKVHREKQYKTFSDNQGVGRLETGGRSQSVLVPNVSVLVRMWRCWPTTLSPVLPSELPSIIQSFARDPIPIPLRHVQYRSCSMSWL